MLIRLSSGTGGLAPGTFSVQKTYTNGAYSSDNLKLKVLVTSRQY